MKRAKPLETRGQYVSGYMARQEPWGKRTHGGFVAGRYLYLAVRCTCKDRACRGWKMTWELADDVKARLPTLTGPLVLQYGEEPVRLPTGGLPA